MHALSANRDGVAVARVTKSWRDGARTFLGVHHLVATSEGVEHLVHLHELTLFTEDEYEQAGLTWERVESRMPGRDRYIASHDD